MNYAYKRIETIIAVLIAVGLLYLSDLYPPVRTALAGAGAAAVALLIVMFIKAGINNQLGNRDTSQNEE